MVGIYKILSPSGKIYIGQTWDIKRRFKEYKNPQKTQTKIYNSISKYGYENHKFEIVHELPKDINQKVLDDYEILYWEHYKSLGFRMLNIKDAGKGGKHSEESIELIRYKSTKYHGISQFDLNGTFIKFWENSHKASIELGITKSEISSCLSGRNKSSKDFMFKEGFYSSNIEPRTYKKNRNIHKIGKRQKRCLHQYDLDGNFIKEWDSMRVASEILAINEDKISNNCRGLISQAGGFKWVKIKKLNNN